MIGIIRKIKKQQAGFTITEVIAAVSIFAVIIVIAIDSFLSVIRVNRESRQYQDVQDHARFLYEMMSKEIRMARVIDDAVCANEVGRNKVYSLPSTTSISFKNYKNECVRYYLEAGKLMVERKDTDGVRTGAIMPGNINVEEVHFDITNFDSESATNNPASVMFYLKLHSSIWDPPTVELQTTIAARYLE